MSSEKIEGKDAARVTHISDTESLRGDVDPITGENPLVRQLKNRHIAMIRYGLFEPTKALLLNDVCYQYWRSYWHRSVASTTRRVPHFNPSPGLFLGTANALRNGGPVGKEKRT